MSSQTGHAVGFHVEKATEPVWGAERYRWLPDEASRQEANMEDRRASLVPWIWLGRKTFNPDSLLPARQEFDSRTLPIEAAAYFAAAAAG